MLRISSGVYSTSNWNERLTDTIIERKMLGWSSSSSKGCWLIVNIGFCSLRSDKEKIQVGKVTKWGRGRQEFRLVELSRWIVTSVWKLWPCTGHVYPDGHVSLQFWTRANRNIWWANRERISWFCRSEFADKTSFQIVLEYFCWSNKELKLWQILRLSLNILVEMMRKVS